MSLSDSRIKWIITPWMDEVVTNVYPWLHIIHRIFLSSSDSGDRPDNSYVLTTLRPDRRPAKPSVRQVSSSYVRFSKANFLGIVVTRVACTAGFNSYAGLRVFFYTVGQRACPSPFRNNHHTNLHVTFRHPLCGDSCPAVTAKHY